MTDNNALELERWPGYTEQSWSERFVVLDRLYSNSIEITNGLVRQIAALRTPAPAPVGGDEPVAWMYKTHLGQDFVSLFRRTHYDGFPITEEAPLYASPQSPPAPETVLHISDDVRASTDRLAKRMGGRFVYHSEQDAVERLDGIAKDGIEKASSAPDGLKAAILAQTIGEIRAALAAMPPKVPFQHRVGDWMEQCFTPEIVADKLERSDRFVEEALELLQACGYDAARAHALVDYVFSRPVGEPSQEVGGVMVTLAALCNPHGLDMEQAAETELARILQPEVIEKIRAKQASKPTGSALPIPVAKVEAPAAFTRPNDPDDKAWNEWTPPSPAADEVRELVEAFRALGGPDQGMNFSSARSSERLYDMLTGKPISASARPAELTVYGKRALFLKSLIDGKGRKLADMLERFSHPTADAVAVERERCAGLLDALLDSQTLKLLAGEMTAQEVRTVKAVLANIAAAIRSGGAS